MATLQEKFGFQDGDLKTLAHDLIMLWLDENVDEVLLPIAERVSPLKTLESVVKSAQWSLEHEYRNRPLDRIIPEMPPIPEGMSFSRALKTFWEYPIATRTNFTVGFVDMVITIVDEYPSLFVPEWSRSSEGPPTWKMSTDSRKKFGVEVKTKIPSLGELMRQLQLYRSHSSFPFIVVSPDNRFASLIRKQGVGFIEVPPEVVA